MYPTIITVHSLPIVVVQKSYPLPFCPRTRDHDRHFEYEFTLSQRRFTIYVPLQRQVRGHLIRWIGQ